MSRLTELRQALARATDELVEASSDKEAYEAKEAEIADLEAQIERAKKAMERQASLAQPANGGKGAPNGQENGGQQGFKSLGEQLLAVMRHYGGDGTDSRLVRAPTGAGETDPTSGGFLVQTDFANTILQRAYETGQILSRVNRIPLGDPFDGIKIPGIDETSRQTGSRWGGVQSYWVGEGDTVTPSRPKFRLIELDLKKLMSLWYVTDELMRSAPLVNAIATQAFQEEVTFMTEDAVFRGEGAGKPRGIIGSNARVTVAKESGQAAGTVVKENIDKMWSRMWARSRANAVWFVNQDVEPALNSLVQVVGTAGVPVYLPANGISGAPYGTLYGRPVVPIEYAESLGTEGDIVLADFSQYVLADKGSANVQSSMHVRFLYDEMVFRITYRVDGSPTWHAPLTPYKGSATKSPFITLATRS